MRRSLAVFCGLLAACGTEPVEPDPAAAPPPLPDFELGGVGLATPESVLHDPIADVYLVSNISGDPFATDNDGFVTRVTPDGQIENLEWIAGGQDAVVLNAPKGMALTDEFLWIADIDHVRWFERTSGRPAGSLRIEGATFLNDLTVGPDGAIYVTDSGLAPGFAPSGTDAVHRIGADHQVETVCSGTGLGQPNGIAAAERDLFTVTWKNGTFGLVTPDGLTAELKLPATQLDGLVRVTGGRWLASSWEGRCIYTIAPGGDVQVLYGDLESPADIGFDHARGRLLVPLFTEDRVIVRKL